MISLIDVECPHCGTQGQIMVPPVGSIIIGPCPKCAELVVVFCGQVLALDKAIMTSSDIADRREHLLGVLTQFLGNRIATLLTEDFVVDEAPVPNPSDFESLELDDSIMSVAAPNPEPDANAEEHITQSEVEQFMDVDLKLLDNRAYFNSVFGQS